MVDANFKKAVENKRIDDIRDFLRVRLMLDHNYVSGMFIECRDYCLSHGISENMLYEKFDGRQLPQANTEENFKLLLGQLSTNFSKERMCRLLEIGKKLWANEQVYSENAAASTSHAAVTSGTKRRVISERLIPTSHTDNTHQQDIKTGPDEQRKNHSSSSSKSNSALVGVVTAVIAVIIIIIIILNSHK